MNPKSLVLLALALAACGEVITPEYEGEPIATVSGQLTAEAGVDLPETVRLAVAWYPGFFGSPSAPKAILTQDVAYRGTFPLRYSFDFYAPPPDAALVAGSASGKIQGRSAFGLLLAYEDRNGNGRLDTMTANGHAPDRILGPSFDWHLDEPGAKPEGYFLLYVEASPQQDAALAQEGLVRGYNLIGVEAPAPISTPIPIALTASPLLALHVCEESFSGELEAAPCGLELPREEPPPLPSVRFGGLVSIEDGVTRVEAQLFGEDGKQITNAEVFAGDTRVPYDTSGQQYVVDGAPFAPGSELTLRARLAGGGERTIAVRLPGDFEILSPALGAEAKAGTTLRTSWTDVAGVDGFEVRIDTGEFMSSDRRFVMGMTSTDFELASDYAGPATLTIAAQVFPDTNFPEGFTTRVGHSMGLTLVP